MTDEKQKYDLTDNEVAGWSAEEFEQKLNSLYTSRDVAKTLFEQNFPKWADKLLAWFNNDPTRVFRFDDLRTKVYESKAHQIIVVECMYEGDPNFYTGDTELLPFKKTFTYVELMAM